MSTVIQNCLASEYSLNRFFDRDTPVSYGSANATAYDCFARRKQAWANLSRGLRDRPCGSTSDAYRYARIPAKATAGWLLPVAGVGRRPHPPVLCPSGSFKHVKG